MKEDWTHPENDFRNNFNPYLSTDDQVYKGGITAYTRNQKDRASLAMPHNDRALWHLINLGAGDMPTVKFIADQPIIFPYQPVAEPLNDLSTSINCPIMAYAILAHEPYTSPIRGRQL